MIGRTLTRGIVVSMLLALAGCATPPPRDRSILDAVNAPSHATPATCEALSAKLVCYSHSRFDRSCGCMDWRTLTGQP